MPARGGSSRARPDYTIARVSSLTTPEKDCSTSGSRNTALPLSVPIIYQSENRAFFLQTPKSTYSFAIHPTAEVPVHWFWGRRIEPCRLSFTEPAFFRPFSPLAPGAPAEASNDILPQEIGLPGGGDFRIPSLVILQENGSRELDLKYSSHRINPGKPALAGLPAIYAEAVEEAETLEIDLRDKLSGVVVTLSYSVFRDFDAICRSVRITNSGAQRLVLQEIGSACVDFPNRPWEILTLPGAWARERHVARHRAAQGCFLAESRRGTSSHQHHPFLALCEPGATEESGEVFAFNLVYSGSFTAAVEVDQFEKTRAVIGLNRSEFAWTLESGESFQSPEAVLVYSSVGLGEMSRTFHKLYRTRLARGKFRDCERPCLINNWEATYFDFAEEKILGLAREAAAAGIELFVLDDGWFGHRDDDTTSLGDWVPYARKLPEGIAGLANKINALGLQFGLWFEPEMVSPDSELYRSHPDWCLHVEGRTRVEGRNQLVLDLSRDEVCNHIIESVSRVLQSAPVSYVKWDMNRHLTNVGSPALPAGRQREVGHRYVLGLYRVFEELTSRFPDVLFEGCSGGGGRFDPGLLHYMPQSWTSDNTDAVSRLKIQYGTSMAYPWSSISAHVSASPNHQTLRTTSLQTRFHVALTGSFGYEFDLTKLPQAELAEIKEQVAIFKKLRPLLSHGEFHRLISPFESSFAAWQLVSADRSEAVAICASAQVEANTYEFLLRLRGLDAEALYLVNGETESRGDVLMNVGLLVPPLLGGSESRLWHLVRKT